MTTHLQDYDQRQLLSLPGDGVRDTGPVPIDASPAGAAFTTDSLVQEPVPGGTRLYLPVLDGTDRVGVLAVTVGHGGQRGGARGEDGQAPGVGQDVLRLAQRLAELVADMLVTKRLHTDRFFQGRRSQPLSLSAEMQWQLLPPLSMTTPRSPSRASWSTPTRSRATASTTR